MRHLFIIFSINSIVSSHLCVSKAVLETKNETFRSCLFHFLAGVEDYSMENETFNKIIPCLKNAVQNKAQQKNDEKV